MQTQNSLSQLLYPLKKRWYLILFSVAIMSVLATRYLYLTTPVYQATSTIKIEDAQQGASSSNLYRDFDVFKTNTKVQTEVEVLKSRNFFMKALNSLDYYVEYYQDDSLIEPTSNEKLFWELNELPDNIEKKEQYFETVIDEYSGKSKKEVAQYFDENLKNGKYDYVGQNPDLYTSFD